MSTMNSPLSIEEVTRRGDEIYERDLKEKLEATDRERLVAIDVTTGSYSLGDTVLKASASLQQEHGADPTNIWILRIGSKAVHRLGRSTA